MKNIIKVFFRDLYRLRINLIALIIAFGMCILPALYAWFNIAANWDPYSNTAGLKIAVVNEDKGYSIDDNITMNCGDQVIDSVKQNNKIGWQFVSRDDAVNGVNSNEYYAAVIIPESFTENLLSFLSGKIEKAEINYYVNEKINAIAPKITDKCIETIETSIDTSFVSTMANTIATILDVSGGKLTDSKDEMLDKLETEMDNISSGITDYQNAITAFDSTVDSLNSLISANKKLIPSIATTLDDTKDVGSTAGTAISAVKDCSGQVTASIGQIITAADSLYATVNTELSAAFELVKNDADASSSKLDSAAGVVERIIDMNNQVKDVISNIADTLDIDISNITSKIDDLNAKQQDLINQINTSAENVRKAGSFPEETQSQINDLVNTSKSALASIQTEYDTKTKVAIDNAMDSMTKTLDSVTTLVTSVEKTIPQIEETFGSAGTALSSVKTALGATSEVLDGCQTKIEDMKTKVEDLRNDNTLSELLETVLSDPQALGDFISSPVSVTQESIYPIENYGSAMSPFYTTLAIWVGGIVLVAILKTEVKEDDKIKNLRPHQCYFGRYLLFFSMGIIQSTIICLGDLFYLGIQCEHKFLFLLAGWVASFVFTLLIYTLTVAFGEIGKALAVIMLVIQLAGSGGTFPVEVLPDFFQKVYPFLPFSYAINAMRETVAGMYSTNYFFDILKVLVYVPVSLLIGLLLRKPLMSASKFFNKRLEDSHLI